MEPVYIKETLINISSMAMFTSPVICILWPQHWKECLGLTVGMLALTMLYPPVGSWMRPHRHSDMAGNRAGLPNK